MNEEKSNEMIIYGDIEVDPKYYTLPNLAQFEIIHDPSRVLGHPSARDLAHAHDFVVDGVIPVTPAPMEPPVKVTTSDIQNEMYAQIEDIDNQIQELENRKSSVIDTNKEVYDRGQRLRKLGFESAPSNTLNQQLQKELTEIDAEFKESTKINAYINRYKKLYPLHRFVPTKTFNEICEKYGLMFADVKYYAKDVPEKNLQELENFMESYRDLPIYSLISTQETRGLLVGHRTQSIEYTGTKEECNQQLKNFQTRDEARTVSYYQQQARRTTYDMERYFSGPVNKTYTVERTGLCIAAPMNQFKFGDDARIEIKGNEVVVRQWVIDDPIISIKVDGGMIIITAWDEVAEDPQLVNPITN